MGNLLEIRRTVKMRERSPEAMGHTPARRDEKLGNFVQGMWRTAKNLKINDYDPIADVFDEVMANDFHQVTHPVRRQVAFELTHKRPLHCLDLCCGTGLFFSLLADDFPIAGYGLDLSKREIEIAKKRKVASNSVVNFRVGDVAVATYPGNIDLVTINFDALNHLKGSAQWRNIFHKALRSLVDDGVLLFDINLPKRLAHDWNWPEIIVKDDLCYIQLGLQPKFRATTVTREIGMSVFSRLPDGRFALASALIEQFAMPARDVLALLKSVGFRHAEVIVATGDDPVGHIFNKNRAFILARK